MKTMVKSWMALLGILLVTSCELFKKEEVTPTEEIKTDCNTPTTKDKNGEYATNQIIVDFRRLRQGAVQQRSEQELIKAGYAKIKSCPCDERLQLWDATGVPGADLETKGTTAEEKGELDGGGTGFNFVIRGKGFQPGTQDRFEVKQGTGRQVLVATVDSGNDIYHPSLQGVRWVNGAPFNLADDNIKDDVYGFDFKENDVLPYDDYGHGTHVAGIISRDYPADEMDLRIMPLRFHNGAEGFIFDAMCAMKYAILKKVQVMNLSWGYYSPKPLPMLETYLFEANSANIVVVASAGNDKKDNDKNPHWPSQFTTYRNLPNVISVAAHSDGVLWSDSNFGNESVDIAAPGVNIFSTLPNSQFGTASGTSMAAPAVSQVAAIIAARNPGIAAATIVECIKKTADNKGLPLVTKGILNKPNAITCR